MPRILRLFFILTAKISAHRRNMKLEMGSPCRQPRPRGKKGDKNPACVTADIDPFWKTEIHHRNEVPKLKN